jgi:hypothetical protein
MKGRWTTIVSTLAPGSAALFAPGPVAVPAGGDWFRAKKVMGEELWTKNIAVGSRGLVEGIKRELAVRAKGRRVHQEGEYLHLRDPQAPYQVHSGCQRGPTPMKDP